MIYKHRIYREFFVNAIEVMASSVSVLGDSQAVRLGKIWTTYPDVSVDFHCARGGWTTMDLKCAVRSGTDRFNQLCVVFIGINDILRGVPGTVINRNISIIIRTLLNNNKTVVLVTLPPTLNANTEQLFSIKLFNIYIQSFQANKRTIVVKFHEQFFPFIQYNSKLYQLRYSDGRPDFIHLSPQGCSLLVSSIQNLFRM